MISSQVHDFALAYNIVRMNARHTLLNHFSQRYPKLPRSLSHHIRSDPGESVVCLSFDLMSIRIGDMWRMSHYMDAIDLLFAEEEEDDDAPDPTKAVEGDVNSTLYVDKSAEGSSKKGPRREAKSGKQQKRELMSEAKAIKAMEYVVPPTKRECSPSSTASDSKKARPDIDMADGGDTGEEK